MAALDDLLALADTFGIARGVGEARVSTLVFNDGKRLRAIRDGETDIGVRRLATAVQWFSDHWPDAAVWPVGIMRPEPTSSEPVR